MKPTYSMELMCQLLVGIKLEDEKSSPVESNWTASGSECVLEYKGQFYKINVTPIRLEEEIKK
jgi:hypothetical protein